MERNVVVCCDGTGNQLGGCDTNVIRVARLLRRDTSKQLLYYDPGVGTLADPRFWSKFGKRLSKLAQLAVGAGLMRNVIEAYKYLMNQVGPRDRVFLFGFSRGAYTVRVLAGMLHTVGLLPEGNDQLLPYAQRYYEAIRGSEDESSWPVCADFRRTFCRATDNDHRYPIHFLGVWDTVSSVGWFWEPASFPHTKRNPSVRHIRHAVSIDERRAFFRTNLVQKDEANESAEERWFPGDHCDVGGGHGDGMLWRRPLFWVLDAAKEVGLLVDDHAANRIATDEAASRILPASLHDSLKGWWRIAEYIPKKRWSYRSERYRYRCSRFSSRYIPTGATVDRTALEAIKSSSYRPKNFSDEEIGRIKEMDDLPEEFPFDRHQ